MSSQGESKWLPTIVSAAIGMGLMFGLGYALSDVALSADTVGGLLGIVLGITAGCYLVTGLIAGAWARQKSAGVSAAMLLWGGNIIYSFSSGVYDDSGGGLITGLIISAVFAIIIGFVGGLIGEKIRG